MTYLRRRKSIDVIIVENKNPEPNETNYNHSSVFSKPTSEKILFQFLPKNWPQHLETWQVFITTTKKLVFVELCHFVIILPKLYVKTSRLIIANNAV